MISAEYKGASMKRWMKFFKIKKKVKMRRNQ